MVVQSCFLLRFGLAFDFIQTLRKGDSLSDIQTGLQKLAEAHVVSVKRLTLDGEQVGEQILNALLQSGGAGVGQVINDTMYQPRKIAKLIRDENAHAFFYTFARTHFQ